jgi:hypothetical protein
VFACGCENRVRGGFQATTVTTVTVCPKHQTYYYQ